MRVRIGVSSKPSDTSSLAPLMTQQAVPQGLTTANCHAADGQQLTASGGSSPTSRANRQTKDQNPTGTG
ncbi:hypothetical protein GOODEAATRI_020683 [Goodea atripinnis]|uniref:Uncharacterized protein n=1 Tax=Goodea atripinnis TaxID=208336 RepID=A0ABV0NCC1_9TELE